MAAWLGEAWDRYLAVLESQWAWLGFVWPAILVVTAGSALLILAARRK